jgi:hypothetical protein
MPLYTTQPQKRARKEARFRHLRTMTLSSPTASQGNLYSVPYGRGPTRTRSGAWRGYGDAGGVTAAPDRTSCMRKGLHKGAI